jgi:GAF domain-containing protein
MEPASDKWFDPLLATQLLLEIAQERSVEPILKKLVDFSVERTGFAFSTVWLVQKGDLCATCKYRSECADQSRCLHLVAGRGRSLPGCGKGLQPYEDLNARVPLNLGPLGEAMATGQLKVTKNPSNQPISVPGFEWLREERIVEYGIRPIVYKGEVLGAIASFSPEDMPETIAPWSRIFADHIGAAIANARAFDEIQHLKAQLELQNAYLQEAVVEAKARP